MKKMTTALAMLFATLSYAQINPAASTDVTYYNGTTSVTGNSGFIYNGTQVSIGQSTYPFRLNVSSSWLNDGISITQTSTSSAALHLTSNPTGGHHYALFSTGASGSSGQGGGGRFVLYDYTAASNRLIVDDRGYVGVGLHGSYTLTPFVKFHVHDGSIKLSGTDPVHGAPNIFWGGNLGASVAGEWGLEYNSGMGGLNFWRPFGSSAGLVNNVLFLGNNNMIGIGTASPDGKLTIKQTTGTVSTPENALNIKDINGTTNFRVKTSGYVYARDITVMVGTFPDYVFAPGYQLMPLNELGQYVTVNRHLPGFPTAAEVDQNGLSLGETNRLLVEKVEELTLYTISLQQQLDALNQQMAELKKKQQ